MATIYFGASGMSSSSRHKTQVLIQVSRLICRLNIHHSNRRITGIMLSPAQFGECAPKFRNGRGEVPPSINETELRGLEGGAFDEDKMGGRDSDDPDDSDFQPPDDLTLTVTF